MTTTNLDPSSIPLPTRRRPRFGETGLRALTAATALLLVAIMVLLVYETARQAWPSIQEFGLGFVTSDQWNVVTGQFGALNFIIGTLLDVGRGAGDRGADGDRDRPVPERARAAACCVRRWA